MKPLTGEELLEINIKCCDEHKERHGKSCTLIISTDTWKNSSKCRRAAIEAVAKALNKRFNGK